MDDEDKAIYAELLEQKEHIQKTNTEFTDVMQSYCEYLEPDNDEDQLPVRDRLKLMAKQEGAVLNAALKWYRELYSD